MTCSTAISNKLVMNKYIWMGRQLRNFNDLGSIINWANAMSHVKGLLLKPKPVPPALANPQPASSSYSPSQYYFPTNTPHTLPPTIPPSSLSRQVISPPTTVCFKPATTKPLTQSPPRCSTYAPSKPSPLTTHTLCLPNISPADSLPHCPKRRRLSIPPSVDIHATTDLPQSTSTAKTTTQSTIIPGQGKHIWWCRDPEQPQITGWTKTPFKGAEEYKVVKTPHDLTLPFEIRKVATGELVYHTFSKENIHFLFQT